MFGGKATEFPLTTKGLFSDECNNRRQQLTWEFCYAEWPLETSRTCQAGYEGAQQLRALAGVVSESSSRKMRRNGEEEELAAAKLCRYITHTS